jgi:hypothetical protein
MNKWNWLWLTFSFDKQNNSVTYSKAKILWTEDQEMELRSLYEEYSQIEDNGLLYFSFIDWNLLIEWVSDCCLMPHEHFSAISWWEQEYNQIEDNGLLYFSFIHWNFLIKSTSKVACQRFRFLVFNATFNNISVISWWSVLLVEETGENHRTVENHCMSKEYTQFEWIFIII